MVILLFDHVSRDWNHAFKAKDKQDVINTAKMHFFLVLFLPLWSFDHQMNVLSTT
jgi:hypothetical protein